MKWKRVSETYGEDARAKSWKLESGTHNGNNYEQIYKLPSGTVFKVDTRFAGYCDAFDEPVIQRQEIFEQIESEVKGMAKVICIAGESGSGKTTSLRNLDPKSTYIIDADRKGLSWKGWRKQYNKENKNYQQISVAAKIQAILNGINKNAPHIKVVVVDTINTIMVDDEMARMKEKNFDKWQDMAQSIWRLVSDVHLFRDDLTVIFMAHTQTDRDDSGYMFTRIKTSGKKLDKIVLESKFTTVLLSKCVDGKYVFETQSKNSTAKSPMGAFDDFEIDNDMVEIIKKLEEY